jgi:anaerobic dimethyl sulfoxide reductase subunit B (iron-sulfur subunit)
MPESKKELMIQFDPEKCIQCHGCEIACKTWRNLDYGVQYRRVLNIWQGEYPRVKNASVSMACLHCVEPACMSACPEEAITKRVKDGLVVVDETLCNGCGICAEACAYGVPQFGDNGVMQKCDLCCDQQLAQAAPPCIDTCPGETLSFIKVSQAEKTVHEDKIAQLYRLG